jgi:hypothetical protein
MKRLADRIKALEEEIASNRPSSPDEEEKLIRKYCKRLTESDDDLTTKELIILVHRKTKDDGSSEFETWEDFRDHLLFQFRNCGTNPVYW